MTPSAPEYTPILKARNAEITALLTAPSSIDVIPLFELQPTAPTRNNAAGPTARAKSAMTDAGYFLDDIARQWNRPLYMDVSRVADPAGRANWWTFVHAMSALHGLPLPGSGAVAPLPPLLPVLHELDPAATRRAAAGLATAAGRAALRVKLPHASPASLTATLGAAASDLGLAPSAVDVVLDWGDQMEASQIALDTLELHTQQVIAAFAGCGTVITAGTPNSAAFVQEGDWTETRREWWLWLRLMHGGTQVRFGDYALYPPTDPVPAAPRYGHLRYSSGAELHVHRRAMPRAGGGLAAAFGVACAHLTGQGHFRGRAFSGADTVFDDCATGAQRVGAAGKWRELASVHHFALVAEQLNAPSAAPPVGTP